MKTLIVVDGGICGFQTRIHANSEDSQNVSFRIVSDCKIVKNFAEFLETKGQIDGYAELGINESVIFSASREIFKASCKGCSIPCAVFKGMQVAAGLALPKDSIIKITKE
ncbi:MAG: hypothetical protein M1135_01580 [Candidatus Omnitrophica bacterium]|nr:hypothetical protein [Candidatus Omnitrophota bacterium]